MQYKSQDSAMQAKSLDGQGKSHSHAPESGTYGAGARSKTLANPTAAADALAGATRDAVVARTRKTVGVVRDYVHQQPWKVVGVAAAGGFVLGLLLARRR